jgi:PhoH-like ATPase
MHDPSALFRFEEHDVYLPMMTLEELDNHKKGMSEVARNARTVSRSLDQLVANTSGVLGDGIPLSKLGNKDATGSLYFQIELNSITLPDGLPTGKADNMILGVVRELQQSRKDRQVVLVSKDINMRIKARALGLPAEDYFNDQVLEDRDLMYSGILQLPVDFWPKHGKDMERRKIRHDVLSNHRPKRRSHDGQSICLSRELRWWYTVLCPSSRSARANCITSNLARFFSSKE